jgi:predicted acylesterase/phospholipase RssA
MEKPDFDAVERWFKAKAFGQARRYLLGFVEGAAGDRLDWSLKAVQKLALATYKDNELQVEQGLQTAYGLLERRADLAGTQDPETLNLAGAIQKRMWEVGGDARVLTRALRNYRRALAAARKDDRLDDWTYSAINVAFVLDLIANEEASACSPEPSERANALRAEADEVRGTVCDRSDRLRPDAADGTWWRAATLAEAHFGRGDTDATRRILTEAVERFDPDDWMRETLARQFAALAYVQCAAPEERERVLAAISPLVTGPAARALATGKIGLALSGGGFRAALFHIGTLARLAELDLLRHIDVISCVSGGSILGALYYLELKKKLQSKADDAMDRADYVAVVEEVRGRLVEALRKDIRTGAMLRSLRRGLRDRTLVTGRMLGSALYATPEKPDPTLHDLVFTPCGEDDSFNPKHHNWRRAAKVPILVINATTLNTGHNWQFTASWMGEPPSSIEPEIDASERLRRLYLVGEAPPPHDATSLSTAVAASAAVPGVFPPIHLDALYPDRNIRLSDGGVHDNQGIFSLIEQDCTIVFISDGCGQLVNSANPSFFAPWVMKRANDILMDTVRRATFRSLLLRLRTRRLRELRFMHLKAGLPTSEVTWIGGQPAAGDAVPTDQIESGLDKRVQRALAAIRTDLDDFSHNECDGLMLAGYRIADRNFRAQPSALAGGPELRENWSFLRVRPLMDARGPSDPDRDRCARAAFAEEIECGANSFFRRARLSRLGRRLRRRSDPRGRTRPA